MGECVWEKDLGREVMGLPRNVLLPSLQRWASLLTLKFCP